MSGNSDHIVQSIAAVDRSVASEKKPTEMEISVPFPNRTVVNPKWGPGSGNSVEMLYTINNILLRASGDNVDRVTIRQGRGPVLNYEEGLRVTVANAKAAQGTLALNVSSAENALKTKRDRLSEVSASKGLKEIQEAQTLEKDIREYEIRLSEARSHLAVVAKMLNHLEPGLTHCRLPVVKSSQQGVTLVSPLGDEVKKTIAGNKGVKEFLAKNALKTSLFITAPPEAWDDKARKPNKLPSNIVDALMKHNDIAERSKAVKEEELAWYEMVVSYNKSCPSSKRISLPKELWFRKYGGPKKAPKSPKPPALPLPKIASPESQRTDVLFGEESNLVQTCINLVQSVMPLLKVVDNEPHYKEVHDRFKSWNAKVHGLEQHGSLQEAVNYVEEILSRKVDIPAQVRDNYDVLATHASPGEGEVTTPPMPDEKDKILQIKGTSMEWVQYPHMAIPDGSVLGMVKRSGYCYYTQEPITLPEGLDSKSAKQELPPQPEPGSSKQNKNQAQPSKKGKEKAEVPPKTTGITADDLNKENPANVKGAPSAPKLSEEERARIRKGLKIPPAMTPDDWNLLDDQAKKAAAKQRSIPKWATRLIIDHPNALSELEAGKILNAKMAKEKYKSAVPKQAAQAKATEGWLKLREKFGKEPLYSNPVTPKGKQFLKEFNDLKKKLGESPAFPTPRERKRSASVDNDRRRTSDASSDPFSSMMKIWMMKMMSEMK